ncbi:type II toxin-antitoxin system Phd/YefM family antitoxin [Thiobacter aerophilum]|uniref:Antitoxin n=1 Tax=Thiobacter aerophilum TaxID=3121275 RepID=A0ABV0EJV2_9BURK
MRIVNMLEAKSTLSKLVELVEQGEEMEILIARNGRPAAKLVKAGAEPVGQRIGVAKGKFNVPEDIDSGNDEIARMFQNAKN